MQCFCFLLFSRVVGVTLVGSNVISDISRCTFVNSNDHLLLQWHRLFKSLQAAQEELDHGSDPLISNSIFLDF
ncbi:hypothetical protein YC2023_038505 [Brassica napus]